MPVHLSRWPEEPVRPEIAEFYAALLELLRESPLHRGDFAMEADTDPHLLRFSWTAPGQQWWFAFNLDPGSNKQLTTPPPSRICMLSNASISGNSVQIGPSGFAVIAQA